eukprot:scaffold268_cov210-Ochromonas_danica.AAC.5
MQDIWTCMEHAIDTIKREDDKHGSVDGRGRRRRGLPVSTELPHRAVALGDNYILNNATNGAVGHTRFAGIHSGLEGLEGDVDQVTHLWRHVTHQNGLGAVAMHSLVIDSDVDIDNVSIAQDRAIRDAMADNFIDRSAAGLGIVIVVERRRIAIATDDRLMDKLVDIICGHPRLCCANRDVQHLASESPGSAHQVDVSRRRWLRQMAITHFLRLSVNCIAWTDNMRWNGSLGAHYSRPQLPRERERRLGTRKSSCSLHCR